MVFQGSARPRTTGSLEKNDSKAKSDSKPDFSSFLLFGIDFGIPNPAQNGDKIRKKRGRKQDAQTLQRLVLRSTCLAECASRWRGFRRGSRSGKFWKIWGKSSEAGVLRQSCGLARQALRSGRAADRFAHSARPGQGSERI